MKINFLDEQYIEQISKLLEDQLFNNTISIKDIYIKLFEHLHKDEKYCFPSIEINYLNFSSFLQSLESLKNLGVDLPMWFGNTNSHNKTMVIAFDPKRNGQNNNIPTLNTVFSLHLYKEFKNSKKNDYWNFISFLIKNSFVYVTDIYKLYYEEINNLNKSILRSNKDKRYTSSKSETFQINQRILIEEISIIKPNKIITLGKDAENVIKKIALIETDQLSFNKSGIEYIFIPHISKTVTQHITTIGKLFKSIGILKHDQKTIELGQLIIDINKKIITG